MTLREAEEIALEMQKGLAFSDEDIYSNEYWCLSYTSETGMYNYCSMWTVIGSILQNTDYNRADFIHLLQSNYNYLELMSLSFRSSSGPMRPEEGKNPDTGPGK